MKKAQTGCGYMLSLDVIGVHFPYTLVGYLYQLEAFGGYVGLVHPRLATVDELEKDMES